MTVTQVIEGVKSSSAITFDFVMYTIAAGCITSAGLMSSNPIDIAAAMCIEPVIATVLCELDLLNKGKADNVVLQRPLLGQLFATKD